MSTQGDVDELQSHSYLGLMRIWTISDALISREQKFNIVFLKHDTKANVNIMQDVG